MTVKVEKQPKSQIKLTVVVEKDKVNESYEKIVEEAIKTAKIDGFREGHAPKEKVIEKVGVSHLYGDVINDLLQTYYVQALKENHIIPLSNPKVEIKDFDLQKDFEFTALVAVRPEVKIKEFKSELKSRVEDKVKQAKKENEEKLKKGEKLNDVHAHLSPNEVVDVLLKNSDADMPSLLVEEETNRMFSRLIDQAQSVGLSLEDYLKAQKKTSEELRAEYEKIAENSLKAEFVLSQLIFDEKVEVTDKDIEDMINASGVEDAAQRLSDPNEKFYIKSILQKNKLITKLIEEAEGEHHHEH